MIWGGISAAQNTSGTPVAVTAGRRSSTSPDVQGLDVTEVADRAEAEALVETGDVDAAIVADSVVAARLRGHRRLDARRRS